MSTLPELTDEQIDAVYLHRYPGEQAPARWTSSWRELRAAFPAPKPPVPEWKDGSLVVTVATGTEHTLPRDMVGVWVEHGTYGLMSARVARDMATALHRAAAYVEENS